MTGQAESLDGGQPGDEPVRERLIAAMIAEVGECGYRSTTVERICARAGARREEFAAEFASKEDCLLAAWDEAYGEAVARCTAAYGQPERWRDQLLAAAEEMLALVRENPAAFRVLVVEVLEAGAGGRARRDLAIRSFASLVDAGRQELSDPESLPYEVAVGVTGSIFLTMRRGLLEEGHSPDQLMRELMCMAVMPYLGVEAAMRELGESTGTPVA